MAQVPYPLTGESFEEFKGQVYELVRQVYEEKLGGADLGDVFSLPGDVLTLVLATSSGLTKSGNALALSPTSTGGLQISTSGASLKLLSTGGLESSASGLNIMILSTGGLQTGSTGASIKCKTGGGATTDADGLSVVPSGVAHSGLSGLTTGDDHTQYRLEAADHSHQTTGAEAGQIDHGAAMVAASLLDDDHTQYQLESDIPTTATARTFHVNLFHFPDPISEWIPTINGAYLAASMTAVKCWLPLNFLKVGDIITTYNLIGDATETNALTLDCKLVQVNKADPLTTTDITNGAIVQVTAGGNFDVAVNPTDTTITTDKQYILEILGTTGVGDEIYVIGAEITITRLI